MFDEKTLNESEKAEAPRRDAFVRLGERMKTNEAHSGLPVRNTYFPHDIQRLDFTQIGTPGSYSFTQGNLAAPISVHALGAGDAMTTRLAKYSELFSD